jgi:hypothetical protein
MATKNMATVLDGNTIQIIKDDISLRRFFLFVLWRHGLNTESFIWHVKSTVNLLLFATFERTFKGIAFSIYVT